jgi:hypothetical protein
MIRGAIDYIASDRVGGWLFSEEASTKTRTVLAFLDGTCIGAGKIEQYREDLADAGVGDGYVGFNFGIGRVKPDDRPRVTVRIEGSDLQLVQKSASIANPEAIGALSSSVKSLSSIEWMLDQGWLTHDEYDYLKQLGASGAYERSLRKPKSEGAGIDAPEPIAATYLGLIAQDVVSPAALEVADVADLIAKRPTLIRALDVTVVAVLAEKKAQITVVRAAAQEGGDPIETAFTIAPDRLLLLDLSAGIKAGDAGLGLKLWGVPTAES